MTQFEILILPGCFLLTALFFVLLGYAMGRRTITDMPLIEKKIKQKESGVPEQSEIMRCLNVRSKE
jgi:hypothetical protein